MSGLEIKTCSCCLRKDCEDCLQEVFFLRKGRKMQFICSCQCNAGYVREEATPSKEEPTPDRACGTCLASWSTQGSEHCPECFPQQEDAKPEADPVTWPSHYNQGEIECLDAMRVISTSDEFQAHCRLNGLKYIWRAKAKGSLKENIEKAIFYLRLSIGDDPRKERK